MPDATNLTTADGLATLQEELAVLEGDGRREIAERIKTAREWGDLKENSEYHDAKNEQAHLETKIARLREKIAAAVIVEDKVGSTAGVVEFGTTPPPPRGACRLNHPSRLPCSDGHPARRPPCSCPGASAR